MSDFIACVGCGATIHKTAPTCPKCGAPQTTTKTTANAEVTTTPSDYAAVPWFRRRWFVLLCVATLTPIASLIAMTGEVFYNSNGVVKQFPKHQRQGFIFASIAWAVYVFSNGSGAMIAAIGLPLVALILAFKK